MKKLMSSLVAATIVGAFSLPVMAASAAKTDSAMPAGHAATENRAASAIPEKPLDAPKKHVAKKHTAKKHVSKKHVAHDKAG